VFLQLVVTTENWVSGKRFDVACQNSAQLPPECQQFCQYCGGNVLPIDGTGFGNDAPASVDFGSALTGLTSYLQSQIKQLESGAFCNSACMSKISCALGILSLANQVGNDYINGGGGLSFLNTSDASAAAFCTALGCIPSLPPPFAMIGLACSLGQSIANKIRCSNYSFGGLIGLPTACQLALIATNPIILVPCGGSPTASACNSVYSPATGTYIQTPKSPTQIYNSCLATVIGSYPQLQQGTCMAYCIQQTTLASGNCVFVPPVGGPCPVTPYQAKRGLTCPVVTNVASTLQTAYKKKMEKEQIESQIKMINKRFGKSVKN